MTRKELVEKMKDKFADIHMEFFPHDTFDDILQVVLENINEIVEVRYENNHTEVPDMFIEIRKDFQ